MPDLPRWRASGHNDLAGLPHEQKFDAIIVDEAQDFADDWWTPLLGSLRDEETGGLFAYSDERQRVFARFGRPPVQLVPLVLDHNLRNTKQIASTFVPLAPTGMELRGGDGPQVTFVPTNSADALEVADDQVEALFDEGWNPGDIFYGHVLGFKGMERRAVVLCVNESGTRDRAAERLYVGLSRATDRLEVVGDPDVITTMGGPEFYRRMGVNA